MRLDGHSVLSDAFTHSKFSGRVSSSLATSAQSALRSEIAYLLALGVSSVVDHNMSFLQRSTSARPLGSFSLVSLSLLFDEMNLDKIIITGRCSGALGHKFGTTKRSLFLLGVEGRCLNIVRHSLKR